MARRILGIERDYKRIPRFDPPRLPLRDPFVDVGLGRRVHDAGRGSEAHLGPAECRADIDVETAALL